MGLLKKYDDLIFSLFYVPSVHLVGSKSNTPGKRAVGMPGAIEVNENMFGELESQTAFDMQSSFTHSHSTRRTYGTRV